MKIVTKKIAIVAVLLSMQSFLAYGSIRNETGSPIIAHFEDKSGNKQNLKIGPGIPAWGFVGKGTCLTSISVLTKSGTEKAKGPFPICQDLQVTVLRGKKLLPVRDPFFSPGYRTYYYAKIRDEDER